MLDGQVNVLHCRANVLTTHYHNREAVMNRAIVTLIVSLFLASGILLGQGSGQNLSFYGSKIVNIAVNQAWTRTGVICAIGDTLYISVRGVSSSSTDDGGAWCGPDGNGWGSDSRFPVPTASQYSVIGKIGASGTGFPVGSGRLAVAQAAGEFYFGINDIINFADNGGALVASIIKQRNRLINTAMAAINAEPEGYVLGQNYPNPFNPSTTIEYNLPKVANVEIRIYNSVGQLVNTISANNVAPGTHRATWDGVDEAGAQVASGSYYYQLIAGDFVEVKKMLHIK
jgi:hypothetical protein